MKDRELLAMMSAQLLSSKGIIGLNDPYTRDTYIGISVKTSRSILKHIDQENADESTTDIKGT